MYGCELWNLSSSHIDKYIIAWRKIKRRIWKIPINSHKHIAHNLRSDCKYLIEKRILKYINNGLNSNNVCANMLQDNLHVKTPVMLIIVDFCHTNITLAVLIGQIIYLFF